MPQIGGPFHEFDQESAPVLGWAVGGWVSEQCATLLTSLLTSLLTTLLAILPC